MKKTTRIGVFETNSSSTHSLVMCSKEQFELWKKGKLGFNCATWTLCNKDEFEKYRAEHEYVGDSDFVSYEEYGSDLEWFEEEHTTPGGETVVAFGCFGWDG